MRKTSLIPALALAAASLAPAPSSADLLEPLRSRFSLLRPRSAGVVRVKTARIVLADYDLLRRDFPFLEHWLDEQVDEWLLESAGWVAEEQARQTAVNTAIEVARGRDNVPLRRTALRPETYNRALVFEGADAPQAALLDVKGTGTPLPRQASHGNGLGTTAEMSREFGFEKLVQRVLEHDGSDIRTVGGYAVIDWGFDVIHKDGSRSPAGALIRQAHTRRHFLGRGNYFLDRDRSLRVERILRRYGIASSREEKWGPGREVVNIQGTRDGDLFDFGTYRVVEGGFSNPTFAYMEAGSPSAEPLLRPNSRGFPQPDPALRIPADAWGAPRTDGVAEKYDRLYTRSDGIIRRMRDGKATRKDLERLHRELMNAAEARLSGGAIAAGEACAAGVLQRFTRRLRVGR